MKNQCDIQQQTTPPLRITDSLFGKGKYIQNVAGLDKSAGANPST